LYTVGWLGIVFFWYGACSLHSVSFRLLMVENYNVNIEYLLLKVNFFKKVCAFFFYVFFFHSPNNKHIVDDWCSRNCDDALNITIFLLQQIFVGKFFNLLENEKSRMLKCGKNSYMYFWANRCFFLVFMVFWFFQNIWFFIALFELWYFFIDDFQ
jgi:hypothetical protein